tara:strand:+ start:52 stop:570 length:519 start_codon:yes stop_codon:yes gene_type:complete
MKKKILPFFISLAFIIIFVIFYRGLDESNIYKPKNFTNHKIPVFNTKEFYLGSLIKSEEIFEENKTYLVNIWSSWCVPCRQEHSLLMNLKDENTVIVIGLNYKDNKINAGNFLKELGNPYEKIFSDLDGTIAIEWGAYGVPESFLIKNNKIIKKYIGPLDQKLINEMKEIIK